MKDKTPPKNTKRSADIVELCDYNPNISRSPNEIFSEAVMKSNEERNKDREEFDLMLKEAGIERPKFTEDDLFIIDPRFS